MLPKIQVRMLPRIQVFYLGYEHITSDTSTPHRIHSCVQNLSRTGYE